MHLQKFNNRSLLEGINYANQVTVPDSATNALKFNEFRTYFEPDYEWHSGDFRFEGKLPIYLQQLYFYESVQTSQSTRLLFNPSLTFRYDPQHGFAGNIYYSHLNNAGSILQTYNGIVLTNYRSFSQNNGLLSVYHNDIAGVSLS